MIHLNDDQVAHIAEVLGNLSIVFFASLISPIFTGETISINVLISGLVLAAGSFIISVHLLKGGSV